MQYACNNKLKQVIKTCSRQRLRAFNGTDYRTSAAARSGSTQGRGFAGSRACLPSNIAEPAQAS